MRTAPEVWFRDCAARRLIAVRYLPLLAVLNLGWEIAQLPLYTIWREPEPRSIAFAVAHCTVGDVLVGSAALALALTLTRAGSPSTWPWLRIGIIITLAGVAYTGASETDASTSCTM